jgi:hypothetical protein
MKTLKQPLEGSVEVTPQDDIVFTMRLHGAEYLINLILGDCAQHPDETAWRDAAALMDAVDTVRARHAQPKEHAAPSDGNLAPCRCADPDSHWHEAEPRRLLPDADKPGSR